MSDFIQKASQEISEREQAEKERIQRWREDHK